jgi:hypothetical protein
MHGKIPMDVVIPRGPRLMARKKTGDSTMPATRQELRAVRLYLPAEVHKKFRRLAADEETNMALLARKIVQDYVASHPLKAGDK